MNNTTTVYAGELRVGDELLYDGEIISIESKGDYINVIAAGNKTSINLNLHDDVTIYERVGLPAWTLSCRETDDGECQVIAVFEDPADAIIYADNEVDGVELRWTWIDTTWSGGRFEADFQDEEFGLERYRYFDVEPITFYSSTGYY